MIGRRTALIFIATRFFWSEYVGGRGRAPTATGFVLYQVGRSRRSEKVWPSCRGKTELLHSYPIVENGPIDNDDDDDDDDIQQTLPGRMKISEIKSELDLRKVSYNDCFDRESLECRLNNARASGKADPTIIDEFNKRNLRATFEGKSLEVSDDMIANSLGGDGTLPGGMPPEMLKTMMGDTELVTMLRTPKMQEIVSI